MTFFLVLLSVVAISGIVLYNRLVRDSNLVKEAWSGIDVQLKRRHDLIPKIVQVASGYMTYEKSVLEEITALRSRSEGEKDVQLRAQLETDLANGVRKLVVVAENYPDLKASANFTDLMKTISQIEEQLQMARRYYNGSVRNFLIRTQTFPGIYLARFFHFEVPPYFQISEGERKVPQ